MSSATSPALCDTSLANAGHLCDHCSNLGHEIRQLCEAKDFTIRKPRALVEDNRSICAFCDLIASDPRVGSGNSTGDFKIYSREGPTEYSDRPTDGIDDMTIESENGRRLQLAVFTTKGSKPATAEHVSGRCIKAASDLDRAREWLSDCLRNHDHGSKRASTHASRLVAVGTADKSEQIRIVDNSNPDETYLAVSYRWGGTNSLLTTAETFKPFHTSIAWDLLPRTFRDAIEIARELGVGYIWIDSLCIIQDDPEDWEMESAKMADIYNGAYLTIMAASASDSQGGFFQDRATIKNMVALPYTDASGTTELSVYVGKQLPGYENVIVNGPLFQRGWVFQERLMSKRKLIFGQDQTYWECNSIVQSESNIRRRDKFARLNNQDNDAFRIFSDPSYKRNDTWEPESPVDLWMNLVCEYSQCSLTYETDRLPSLGGLARSIAQQFGDSYAAGLWQNQMPASLSWYTRSYMSKEVCATNYCAPSWSWASTTNAVLFHTPRDSNELEVVSTDIKLAGRDPYGRVLPGSSICVRGRLRGGTLVRREEDDMTVWLETEQGRLEKRGFLDRDDEDLPLQVTYLEISPGDDETHAWALCLLLHRTETDGNFRRVGLAYLAEVSREEDYLFHGLEKQVITIV